VKVDLPKDEVERCKTDRDVYVVRNTSVKLTEDMNPTFGKTGDKSAAKK